MSYSVPIVGEDPTNNGYILDPIVRAILAECGRPRAKVEVLRNPRTEGYEHAKKLLEEQVFRRYRHKDLILFIPDADGKDRGAEFASLEKKAQAAGVLLICCASVQEVEVWLLAGHAGKLGATWNDVREDTSVKEHIFDPFLGQYGDSRRPGGGRDLLIAETLKNYQNLLTRCPELEQLQTRICAAVSGATA